MRLVGILRQFEMLQQTITIGSEMNRRRLKKSPESGSKKETRL